MSCNTGKGSDKDYILNTTSVIISPDTPGIVNIIFRVDGLALEPPETLQLILQTQNAPSGDGSFCISDLDLVIEDADGKKIAGFMLKISIYYLEWTLQLLLLLYI